MITIFDRILIAGVVIILFFAGLWFIKSVIESGLKRRSKTGKLPVELKPGKPALLYFSSKTCAPCKLQEKYLDQAAAKLKQEKKEVELMKFDAQKEKKLVSLFKIVTVPTIVVINTRGEITALNVGLTKINEIINQLKTSN